MIVQDTSCMAGLGGGAHKGSYGTASTGDGPRAVTRGRGAHTGGPEPVAPAPVAAAPAARVVSGGWQIEGLPATVRRAGPQAAERTVECVTAQIRNPYTRAAYAAAVTRFFTWCDARGLALAQLSPIAVATYIEDIQGRYRAPSIKQHLAAIRRLFDWLVTGQVVPTNPATSVRGPTHVVKTGKTPVLQPAEARLLLDSIDTLDPSRPARSRAAGRDGLRRIFAPLMTSADVCWSRSFSQSHEYCEASPWKAGRSFSTRQSTRNRVTDRKSSLMTGRPSFQCVRTLR